MSYKNFGSKNIDIDNSDEIVESYQDGYVLTRKEHGYMERVRSLRVNLSKFKESSENRRILRKYAHELEIKSLPYENYSWEIHKMGKDFYDTKFGKDTFSANKIKEIFTSKSNFNAVITFKNNDNFKIDGYCITQITKTQNQSIIHYAYPFYNLDLINSSFGMFMMTKSIQYFKEQSFDYVYLGSVHEKSSLYKLQFEGLEWWNEEAETWCEDLKLLKERVLSQVIQ